MIILHTQSENNYKTNGLGLLDRFIIAPNVHWEMNGEYSFEFDYPLHAHLGQELENEMQIEIVTDKYSDVFRIKKIEKSMGMLTVYCEHKSYDLIDNFIEDINLVRTSGDLAVERISAGAQYEHPFRITSTIERTASARMVRMGVMEALLDDDKDNSFINRWGGEIYRHYNQVQMHDTIGKNRGVSITHRKDLVGYNATLDHTEVVTRIRSIGKDAFTIPELYVDSPLIDHYPHPKIKEIKYDVEAEGQEHSSEEALPIKEAEAELRRLARLEYSKYNIDKPKGVYEIDFVALENMREYEGFGYLQEVHGGDTVEVIHEEDGLNIFARVMEYDLNPVNGEYTFMRLGEYTEAMSVLANIPTKLDLKNAIDRTKKELEDYTTMAANGKNQIIFSTAEPVETENKKFLVGDLWLQKIGDGDITSHIWNGEFWEVNVSTSRINKIQQQVSQVSQTAQTALENTSTQKTDITALQDRAGAIESDIVTKNTAIQDDIRAINTNIGGVKGDISSIQNNVSGIQTDISGVNTDISGIRTNIESLQGELVETEPGTLAYKINEVDKTADGITASLGSYAKTRDLDGLASETYVTNQLTLTEQGFNGKLVDYAKTTDLTGLASETYVNSQVTAKADELSLKMDDYALSTDLTGLATEEYAKTQARTEAGKVSGQLVNYAKTTDLSGLASETYVNTQVNAEAGRVDGLLQSYAKSSDLTGLASEEYARTQASAEAGKVEVQLTNYATKSYVDGIEVGGRNLLKVSLIGSHNASVDTSRYVSEGVVRFSTSDINGGIKITAHPLLSNTEYVMSYKYKKTSGTLVSFGGHTDLSWRHNNAYVDGIERGAYKIKSSVFVSDDDIEHEVVIYINTPDEITVSDLIYIQPNRGDETPVGVDIYDLKLEKGNKATDWTPAPEDMASVEYTDAQISATSKEISAQLTDYAKRTDLDDYATTTSLNSVKSTADGNTSNISKILGGNTVTAFNQKVETAYGEVQTLKRDLSVGGTTYELIREIENTASGTKDTITRVEKEIDYYTTVSVNRNLIDEKTAKKNTYLLGTETFPDPTPTGDGAPTATNLNLTECLGDEYYTASKDTDIEYFRISYFDESKNHILRVSYKAISTTFITPKNAKYMWISFPMNQNAKVEIGKVATESYTPITSFNTFKRTVDETYLAVGKTNGNATSLQLTDGSILAGIVKDGRTNKLHLTDQYFYGGQKFITDHVEATYAEMDNLRVNSTIDASNINVINLNASNITSGFMSSNRMRVDGDFEMRGKAIRFTNNGELSTIIDRERIHMYDQTNNARYVGSMGATRLLDYQDVSYMSLRHQAPSYMSLDYRGTDSEGNTTYLPYVVFDAYKVNPYNNDSYFTRFLESVRFYKNARFDGDNYFTKGSSALGIRSYTDRMFIGNMVNLTGLMIYRGGTITVMENGTGKYNLHSVTP